MIREIIDNILKLYISRSNGHARYYWFSL